MQDDRTERVAVLEEVLATIAPLAVASYGMIYAQDPGREIAAYNRAGKRIVNRIERMLKEARADG